MNLTELNSEFEILFEDLATNGSKGLDAYEKSVCYTHVQEELVRELAKANNLDAIQNMVSHSEESNFSSSIYSTGKKFTAVTDALHVLDYFVKPLSEADGDIPAIGPDQSVIKSMLASAYKYPPKNLAYVVMGETSLIVFPPFNYGMKSLVTKYVKFPNPIILDNLTGDDSVNGIQVPTNPQIHQSYHRELVRRAVQYAITVYIGQPEKEVKNDRSRNQQQA